MRSLILRNYRILDRAGNEVAPMEKLPPRPPRPGGHPLKVWTRAPGPHWGKATPARSAYRAKHYARMKRAWAMLKEAERREAGQTNAPPQ